MGTWKKTKEYAYGKAQKPTTDNPNAPKLKGWVKLSSVMEMGKFYEITLWRARDGEGYNVKIAEEWKPTEEAVTETKPVDLKKELDDEIPF